MAKGLTTVSDFAVAPRRSRPVDPAAKQDDPSAEGPAEQAAAPLNAEADQPSNRLLAPTEEARRERSVSKALQREDSRVRLRDLKRARGRESKHYVNCPLDYETKKRLEKASFENDVKMTVIMKAAIDQYLKDNGY
ncbi:hypothetical protein [Ensifer sesbaniae]|uniref:hypothetical protein n=1 Tax=Ensifer sesbaniae TaxID=1214071 RepID=UPI001FEA360C|nr:hypothetical protein [Ensifer sesbaniae]NRQ18900.1 hypothetical protein [Ensifer sesbaniae]